MKKTVKINKKYHLTKKSTVEICTATVRECPLGGHSFHPQELQDALDSTNFAIEKINSTKKIYKKDSEGKILLDKHGEKQIEKGSFLEEVYGKEIKKNDDYKQNKIMFQKRKSEEIFKEKLKRILRDKKHNYLIKDLKLLQMDIANAKYYEKNLLKGREEAERFIEKFVPLIVEHTYAEYSSSVYVTIHKKSLPLVYDYLNERFKNKVHDETNLPQLIFKPNLNSFENDSSHKDLIAIRFSNHIPKMFLENTTFVETPAEYNKMSKEEKEIFNKGEISRKIKKSGVKIKLTKEQLATRLKESILITTNQEYPLNLPLNSPEFHLKNSEALFNEAVNELRDEIVNKKLEIFKSNNGNLNENKINTKRKDFENDFKALSFDKFLELSDNVSIYD